MSNHWGNPPPLRCVRHETRLCPTCTNRGEQPKPLSVTFHLRTDGIARKIVLGLFVVFVAILLYIS